MKNIISLIFTALILTACGAGKTLTDTSKGSIPTASDSQKDRNGIGFLRNICDNALYNKNLVASINFSLAAMGKDISVGGKLQMRRDEVIRITLRPFGIMEVGCIEFAKDYVLVVDRINQQYVKASYGDIDFLRDNNLDFYTLQALFWNELFITSKKAVSDSDLSAFSVDMEAQENRPVRLQAGDLHFLWTTDVKEKAIKSTEITYRKGTRQESKVSLLYDAFVPVGTKKFPSKEEITFNSNSAGTGRIVLGIEMSRITNDSNWDAVTTVSSKYKQVSAQEALSKIVGQ